MNKTVLAKTTNSTQGGQNPQQRTLQQVSRAIAKDYRELQNWRKVGEKWGISSGLAYRIANEDYDPKGAKLRCLLGLPALVLAPPCPIHGVVHTRKTCPQPRQFHGLLDMPVKLLRWKLEHREEVA